MKPDGTGIGASPAVPREGLRTRALSIGVPPATVRANGKGLSSVRIVILLIAATVLLLSARSGRGEGLRAGLATCEITPPTGFAMWGYSAREGVSQSVHDPLMAKVLALATDAGSLAIVTLDLGRPFDGDLLQVIEKRAAEAGIEHLMVVASHTHQGPDMESRDWPSPEAPWQEQAAAKVAEAVAQAAKRMRPALLGFGAGQVDLAHNRRLILPDGTVVMFWRNAERVPTSPVDKTVRVLRVDSTDADHLALLVNYACHPVVLGPDNLMLSADYVGAMREAVQAEWGGECFFLQGACGDINPYVDKTPLAENGLGEMEKMGRELGQEVLRVAQAIEVAPPKVSKIAFPRRVFELKCRWDFSDPATVARLMEKYRGYVEQLGEEKVRAYIARMARGASVPVSAAVMGDTYALCGFPGEFFVDFQIDLARRSPLLATMFLGYADGYAGYFPTIKAAAEGGYGANYSTGVEVGAGEQMVDYAIISILEATGVLLPVPAGEAPDYPPEDD